MERSNKVGLRGIDESSVHKPVQNVQIKLEEGGFNA